MRTIVLSAFGLGLVAHAAAAAGPGPVPLTDAALDQVQAGQTFPPLTLSVFKNVAAQDLKLTRISTEVQSLPEIQGNTAQAEAGATAMGENSFTDTLTLADAVQGQSSAAYSESVAAVGADGPTP
jgi:hypothetical protein